jgi:hypothetical protein
MSMLSEEAKNNTNFAYFALTRYLLERVSYRARDQHANYYTTGAVYTRYGNRKL